MGDFNVQECSPMEIADICLSIASTPGPGNRTGIISKGHAIAQLQKL
jgi:hypothetical protein